MVNVFSKNWNTIGNLAIVLLFLGGCVFMFTGSWNASETEAASDCCGGDTTATTLTAASPGGCCGGANRLSGSGDNCTCVSGANCSDTVCATPNACGENNNTQNGCTNTCNGNKNLCKTDGCCDGTICKNATQCSSCDHN